MILANFDAFIIHSSLECIHECKFVLPTHPI